MCSRFCAQNIARPSSRPCRDSTTSESEVGVGDDGYLPQTPPLNSSNSAQTSPTLVISIGHGLGSRYSQMCFTKSRS